MVEGLARSLLQKISAAHRSVIFSRGAWFDAYDNEIENN
jgi:hypothetical protein